MRCDRGGATAVLTRPAPTAVASTVAPVTWVQKLTLVLIGIVLVLVLVLHLPISFVAITAGAILAFTDLKGQNQAIADISWSTVLLVAGMITYISIMQEMGTIDHLAEMAVAIGAPLLVALVLCYVIGVTSAFASSTALLTAIIPLALPLLQHRRTAGRRCRRRPRDLRHRRRRLAVLHQRRTRPR